MTNAWTRGKICNNYRNCSHPLNIYSQSKQKMYLEVQRNLRCRTSKKQKHESMTLRAVCVDAVPRYILNLYVILAANAGNIFTTGRGSGWQRWSGEVLKHFRIELSFHPKLLILRRFGNDRDNGKSYRWHPPPASLRCRHIDDSKVLKQFLFR